MAALIARRSHRAEAIPPPPQADRPHSLSSAALVVGAMSVVVGLAMLVREQIVAHFFGAGDAVDAFVLASMLPIFLITVVATSLASAYVPVAMSLRTREGAQAGAELSATILLLLAAVLIACALVLWLAAPYYIDWIATGFDEGKRRLTEQLLYLLLPMLVLGGVSAFLTAELNAAGRFALPALAPALVPMLAGAGAYSLHREFGIVALAYATVAGFGLQFLVLGGLLMHQFGVVKPSLRRHREEIERVGRHYLPLLGGAALMATTPLLDQAMAAWLAPGSVALLSFGSIITMFASGFGARVLGGPALSIFSALVAQANWTRLSAEFDRSMKYAILASLPISAVLLLFSEPITALLFGGGAFTAATAREVAWIQQMLCLQIPWYVASILAVRLLSALGLNRQIFAIAAANVLLNALLNYLLMQWLGVAGIALATSMVYGLACAGCWLLARRHLKLLGGT